jgi:hypothetical protein
MIYIIEFLFIASGFLVFFPMILLNQRYVKESSGKWGNHTVTYFLLVGLLFSFGLIIFDILVADLEPGSGFQGFRGFLAYTSFLVYLFDTAVSAFQVKKLQKRLNQ